MQAPRLAALLVVALLGAGCGTGTVDAALGAEPRTDRLGLHDEDGDGDRGHPALRPPRSTAGSPATAPIDGVGTTGAPPAPPTTSPPTTAALTGGLPPPPNIYAATTAGKLAASVADVPARVYVPNSEGGTVSVIDPASLAVVDELDVGATPHRVVPSWDLRTLWVLDAAGGTMTPFDPATGRPGRRVSVRGPSNLYFTPDGATAIVVSRVERRLDLYDPLTWQPRGSVPIPHAGVAHGDFSPNGRYFFASCELSGWVAKVDVAEQRVVAEAQVGALPVEVRLAPDTSVLYVADQGRHGVVLVDPTDLREVGFVPTGRGAHGLHLSRDTTRLYVGNRLEGTVSVVDLASEEVVATWRVPGGGSPGTGGVSADGTLLWLAGGYHGEVYAFDTTSGELVRRIATGAGPHSLTVFPQPGRYSLGHGLYR